MLEQEYFSNKILLNNTTELIIQIILIHRFHNFLTFTQSLNIKSELQIPAINSAN